MSARRAVSTFPGRPGSGSSVDPRSGAAPVNVPHSESRIFAILGQFAVMQFVLACTALIRNKVVAFRLGPTAFGEISQIAAAVSVVSTVASFGMAVSLSRNAAKCLSVGDRQHQLANANGIVLALAGAGVSTTLLLVISGHLLPLAGVAQTPASVFAAVLFIVAIPFEVLKNNYLSFLQGILDVRGLTVRRSAAVLLTTVIAVPLVWFFGFVGAAIQFFLLTFFVGVLLGFRCRYLGYSPLKTRLDKRVAMSLATFGVVSVVSGFAQTFSDAAVRTHLIEAAGAMANGLLQAPYVLSTTVKSVVLASIGSISLATIAPKTDRDEISTAIAKLLNVVIPLGAAALALLGLLGAPALTILYSRSFAPGAAFFPYILAGDLLMVFVWVIGAPMLAFGDRVLWLLLDLLYAGTRWGIAVLLMEQVGSLAVVVGYVAGTGIHAALNIAVYRWRYRLQLQWRHMIQLFLGFALVCVFSVVGAHMPHSLPVTLAAGAMWFGYAAHHARGIGVVSALLRPRPRG